MAENEYTASIVILGAMNPRVHQVLFYKGIGAITADEAAIAEQAETTMCAPQVAQIVVGPMTITCVPDRWVVAAPSQDTARMLEIATKAMDALMHTPVSAFGFNFDEVRQVPGIGVVDTILSDIVAKASVGFEISGGTSASFKYLRMLRERDAARKWAVTVAPGGTHEAIRVSSNFHYDVIVEGDHFDVGAMMRARHARDQAEALAQVDRTVAALRRE